MLSDLADTALDLKNGSMGRVPPFVPHEHDVAVLPMDKAARGQGDVGTSDPYAKLDYVDSEGQRQSVRTPTIDKTLRPQWIDQGLEKVTFPMTIARGAPLELRDVVF